MQQDDLHVRVAASRIFAGCLVVFVALFSAGFLYTGVDALPHAPLWEWGGTVLLGLALALLAERVWRYFFLPQLSVLGDRLVLRPFLWRTRVWPYATTQGWSLREERIEKDWRGRRLPVPLTVERLIRTDTQGHKAAAVLPGFAGQNGTLLKTLEARSGLPVRMGAASG